MPVIASLALRNGEMLKLDANWPGASEAADIKIASILYQPSNSVEQEVAEETDDGEESGVETVKQNNRGRYIIVSSYVNNGRFLSIRLWEESVAFEEVLFTGTEINELFETLSDVPSATEEATDTASAPA